MTTAQNIFVAYGVVALTYAFLLGIALAAERSKAPAASRHLVNTHLSGLMQGPVHLGLAFAVGATGYDNTLATVGAVLLVAGTGLELLGGTANWLQKTGDQFAEQSTGFKLNSVSGLLAVPGILIVAIGVLVNL